MDVGRYHGREVYEQGPSWVSYIAEDPLLQRQVLLTVLAARKLTDEQQQQLLSTAITLAALKSRYVARLLDVGQQPEADGTLLHYFISEFAPGLSEGQRRLRDFAQVLQAIKDCHEHGLHYGPLKWQHVRLTASDDVSLTNLHLNAVAATGGSVRDDLQSLVAMLLELAPLNPQLETIAARKYTSVAELARDYQKLAPKS